MHPVSQPVRVGVAGLLVLLIAAAPARAVTLGLIKYDDFENSVVSTSLWTVTTSGLGAVTLNEAAGGDAVNTTDRALTDATNGGTASKTANITATGISTTFNNVGDRFRIAWDQKKTNGSTAPSAANGGVFLVDTVLSSARVTGGSVANAGAFVVGGSGTGGASSGSTTNNTWYHYDLITTLADLTGNLDVQLRAYSYSAALANNPAAYESLSPLATILVDAVNNSGKRKSVTLGNPFEVTFGPFLGAIALQGDFTRVDNVFVEGIIPQVPEPATFSLIALSGLALAVWPRRAKRHRNKINRADLSVTARPAAGPAGVAAVV